MTFYIYINMNRVLIERGRLKKKNLDMIPGDILIKTWVSLYTETKSVILSQA